MNVMGSSITDYDKCPKHSDIKLRQRKDKKGFYCPVCAGIATRKMK